MIDHRDFPESWVCEDRRTITVPRGISQLAFACPVEFIYPGAEGCEPGHSLTELITGSNPDELRDLVRGIDAYRKIDPEDWLQRRMDLKRDLIREYLED